MITYDKATDDLTCSCGNTTHTDGFIAVDESVHQEIEPRESEGWEGRYMCLSCSATIVMDDFGDLL